VNGCMCSSLFEVGQQCFRLEVYPGGHDQRAAAFVSVYLTTAGNVAPLNVLYDISIVDRVRCALMQCNVKCRLSSCAHGEG
jgi:hypothetical protein